MASRAICLTSIVNRGRLYFAVDPRDYSQPGRSRRALAISRVLATRIILPLGRTRVASTSPVPYCPTALFTFSFASARVIIDTASEPIVRLAIRTSRSRRFGTGLT